MTVKGRALTIQNWPKADREAWKRTCLPGLRLRPGGAAARMKHSTRASLIRSYGYLLDHCLRREIFDPSAGAARYVTPDIIDGFLQELNVRVSSVSRASYISKIRRVATIFAPERDFTWLAEIESDLRYLARPRPKYGRIISSERLFRLGIEVMRRGEESTNLTELARARLVRDGLMIALLALCPIRLRNLADLRLGQHLRKIGETWWIILTASETKSNRPDERPVPEVLTTFIDRWVDHWRRFFRGAADAVWPSIKGGRLAYTYVGNIITKTTFRELGVAVNPHLFRDCAVYTVASTAGDQMGIACGLLQHSDPRVTEKHYNRGAISAASRRYQAIIRAMIDP